MSQTERRQGLKFPFYSREKNKVSGGDWKPNLCTARWDSNRGPRGGRRGKIPLHQPDNPNHVHVLGGHIAFRTGFKTFAFPWRPLPTKNYVRRFKINKIKQSIKLYHQCKETDIFPLHNHNKPREFFHLTGVLTEQFAWGCEGIPCCCSTDIIRCWSQSVQSRRQRRWDTI